MEKDEFATVAECINTCIRFYYENKNKPDSQTLFNEWLESPETKERMRAAMRRVLAEERKREREDCFD